MTTKACGRIRLIEGFGSCCGIHENTKLSPVFQREQRKMCRTFNGMLWTRMQLTWQEQISLLQEKENH